ncbi:SurA N-terminal domain-containing protein [Ornithinibacillus sp. 179-J 7C1 HS]|uniref:SurA N-terminal domain-containing protein n=1 Tax=Ornithinibacillus sp. 179-J 7C1 HS TaxID=3142384 RepID=UPI0039A31939
MKKWLLSLFLLLLTFGMVACNDDTSTEDKGKEQAEGESTEQEMPQPDLENLPDVVAEVNGEKISKEEFESTYQTQFQQLAMQSQMTGQEIDQDQLKGQIVDALIGQKLVIQEAEKGGYEASEDAINKTLDNLVAQNGLESQDAFFTALEEQGMTKEEVMTAVKTQVKVDKLIASESGEVEPTKEELQEAYDTYKAQLEQMSSEAKEVDIPTYEEMEADLIAQVKAQKESKTYQTLVEKLKADADITKNI